MRGLEVHLQLIVMKGSCIVHFDETGTRQSLAEWKSLAEPG